MNSFLENYEVAPGFEDVFAMTPEEQDEHEAYMVSLRILSEVQKTLEARNMTRKQLAEALGTSASYLTQLFRADKLLNLEMIVKLERVLGLRFQIQFAGVNVGAYQPEELQEKVRALNPYHFNVPPAKIPPTIDWQGGSQTNERLEHLTPTEKQVAGNYSIMQAA